MVVQGSPVETTAQSTRLASSERFSSVEPRNVYKQNEVNVTHSWSASPISAVSVAIRYDTVAQGLLHDLLAWLVTRDSR